MIILAGTAPKMSLLDLMMKGGWLMIPLLILSLISAYIFFDRVFYFWRQRKAGGSFFSHFRELLKTGNITSATALCAAEDSSESRILLKGIQNLGKSVRDIQETMEMEGKLEVYKYEGSMYFLGVIAAVAPMLGFIGTISGVIKIFYNISLADNISISLISGGLYEKLICSGVGLGIGILAYLEYHYLNYRINRMVRLWDYYSTRFIDLINNTTL
jgi:biopolymer transport protein ExbB